MDINRRYNSFTAVNTSSDNKFSINRILVAIVVFVMMLTAIIPAAVYAADNQVTLTVEQIYSASSFPTNTTFSYRLTAMVAGNPMPAGSPAEGYTFSISGTGSAKVGPMEYTRPGIYRYELFQVIVSENPDYIYDKQVYTIVVYVDEALNTSVIVLNERGGKAEAIVFENSLKDRPGGSHPVLSEDSRIEKLVIGRPDRNADFTFRLTARNISQPMPSGSLNGVKTVSITGSGQGRFGAWSYDKAGTYYYTVYEENSRVSGYTYDTNVYTIIDTVTDENGQLLVSRIITDNKNTQVTTMLFTNIYRTGGGTTDPPERPDPTETPGPAITPIPTGTPGPTVTPGPSVTPGPAVTPGPSGRPGPTDPPGSIDPLRPTRPGDQYFDDGNNTPGGGRTDLGDDPGTTVMGTSYAFVDVPDGEVVGDGVEFDRPKQGVTSPKTGDETDTTLYTILFVSGGLLVLGAVIWLVINRKRGKELS